MCKIIPISKSKNQLSAISLLKTYAEELQKIDKLLKNEKDKALSLNSMNQVNVRKCSKA